MQAPLLDQKTIVKDLRDQNLVVKWLDFKEYSTQIKELRKAVFVEQQGFEQYIISSPQDINAIHLGCFNDEKLISIITTYLYHNDDKIINELGLPSATGWIANFSRRAQLPEYENTRLAQFLASVISKSVYDLIQPEYSFIALGEEHRKLGFYYSTFGYKFSHEVETPQGRRFVFILTNENKGSSYTKIKRIFDVNSAIFSQLKIPSFFEHLEKTDLLQLFNIKKNFEENLYTAPLSFKDEFPRLIAQSRLMYAAQKDILEKELPKGDLNFLDLGCGPGVYISLLRTNPEFKNFRFTGLDLSPEMILYARFTDHSNIWKYSSAYDTGFENEQFDIIHASFLFIHLQSPELALKEIFRILKPGGTLYIVDVIDNTFEGPRIIKRLINKHTQIDEGNRNVLNTLPQIAADKGFRLKKTIPITIDNTGEENTPTVEKCLLKLGRVNMWAMFAFIGQRKEIQDLYYEAETHYFGSYCKISIQVHTQIYFKN